jgi:DNA repair exonuclease SbcCD ATPase subunit
VNRTPLGLLFVVLIIMTACAVADSPMQASRSFANLAEADSAAEPEVQAGPRKIIRTVDLDLTVSNTEESAQEVQSLAEEVGGYVSSFDAQRYQGILHYNITLRVPGESLDDALSRLRKLAQTVDRENLRTEDVTDRVIDLGARLRTLNATEVELQALLAESRAQNRDVEGILAIYRELTEIRSKIENLQGQLESLERRVAYSTINLSLRPTESALPVVGKRWSPLDTARSSVRALVRALQLIADLAIFLIILAVPVALVLIVAFRGAQKVWRLANRRKQKENGPSSEQRD